MSRIVDWVEVGLEPAEVGLEPTLEEGNTVFAWLWEEVCSNRSSYPTEELAEAARKGRDLFRGFMEDFSACFLTERAPGERWVREALRTQIGFAPDNVVEAVLDRIDERRFHLLESFRKKYQPSLFGPTLFDRDLLPGYFRRVAYQESRHVPLNQLLGTTSLIPESMGSPADLDDEDEGLSFGDRARMLADFWATARFSPEMRLEGLVSLALGDLTGDPVIADRCRDWLAERLPRWELRREQLVEQVGQALARLDREQARLTFVHDWNDRDAIEKEMARLRAALEQARLRLQRHHDRLLPRPQDVAKILEGRVNRPQSRLRFERLRRESALLEQRVRVGGRAAGSSDPEVALLGTEVEAILANRPASPRCHGLSSEERERRRIAVSAWQDRCNSTVRRARKLLTQRRSAQKAPDQGPILCLVDIVCLFDFALLDTIGVLGGLRRPAWQVECLLRVE